MVPGFAQGYKALARAGKVFAGSAGCYSAGKPDEPGGTMRNLFGIALPGLLAFASPTFAQDWPTRPMTMVVPFAAGGPVDTLGRVIAPRLSELLGQQVVIANAPGAGGMTGTNRVKEAAPDGYTFVLGSIGTHTLNPMLAKKPLYDAAADFAPVILIVDVPLVLIARKDLPPNDLREFIAYAKANQKSMQYGSGGTGTSAHISCVLLNLAMGVDVTHVPYRGGGPALVDLIAGRVDYICNIISTAVPAIEAKNVKAIATLTRERASVLPNLATAHEQGLTGFGAYTWNAIFLPRATPRPIVDKLNAAVRETLKAPAVAKRLDELGLTVVAPERQTPEYLRKFVVDEIAKWSAPVKASMPGN
jgi:tripartite-type tricarboxylate transporter receptor subunit TctC